MFLQLLTLLSNAQYQNALCQCFIEIEMQSRDYRTTDVPTTAGSFCLGAGGNAEVIQRQSHATTSQTSAVHV